MNLDISITYSDRPNALLLRFKREAEALAKIDHPNIVSITDFGVLNKTSPYLVLEYIEGITLRQLLEARGKLSERDAIIIAKQICSGLNAAHQQNIVHRDLKPENIMIKQMRDDELIVRVLDFGIAKMLDQSVNEEITNEGEILGTIKYITPEQLMGNAVDVRSDIYSICLIIYEMLTGRAPTALDPQFQPLSLLRSDISIECEKIVLKGLSQKPEQRQQSVLELKQQLDEVAEARFFSTG
jgi:serine/threonine-protein kinase